MPNETFYIGDDGLVSVDGTEITSAYSVTIPRERTDIESADRASDRVKHRSGKMDGNPSISCVYKPDDAGVAALFTAVDDNDPVHIVIKADAEDTDSIEDAEYNVQSSSVEQPLEERQEVEFELTYYDEYTG